MPLASAECLPSLGVIGLLAFNLASCGASDQEAPPYPDPGPQCASLDERTETLTRMLQSGELPGLRRALEESLSQQAVGGLVEVLSTAATSINEATLHRLAQPDVALQAALIGQLLGRSLEQIALSRDAVALGEALRRAVSICEPVPSLNAAATLLRAPALRETLVSLAAFVGDSAAYDDLHGRLFQGEDQRRLFPHVGNGMLCLMRETDNDLAGLHGLLQLLVGELVEQESMAALLRAILSLLAPGTELRDSMAGVAGCLVGHSASPEAYACPQPLSELAPDPEGAVFRALWDALASGALVPDELISLIQSIASSDAGVVEALAEVLDALAADSAAATGLAELLTRVLAPELVVGVLRDLAKLLLAGAGEELLDALVGLGVGCTAAAP